ncbi:hypothetical protein MAR_028472 [Mya arenaria]|uniref:Uncharacterized protein n=1 Tax=Mya arenaria TaxID=6604 RepID=A0ABY7DDQ9_MYAAR|nr:hypothetical protein MAR_028472 [Mya arenaria]
MAFNELDLLELSLLSIRESNELIHITVASVIVTQNNFINARAELTNIKLQNVCKTHGWVYFNNSDIKKVYLYDTVHLNENGEKLFVNRLLHVLCTSQLPLEKQGIYQFHVGFNRPKTCSLQEDIRNRKLLVYKERYGRTHLHTADCHFTRKEYFPLTVYLKNYKFNLFRDMGRSGEWDPVFHTGNPAAETVGLEQAAYNVTITTTSGAINDESICPVIFLQKYITFAKTIVVDLTHGYLFRLKDKYAKHISENQVTATAI